MRCLAVILLMLMLPHLSQADGVTWVPQPVPAAFYLPPWSVARALAPSGSRLFFTRRWDPVNARGGLIDRQEIHESAPGIWLLPEPAGSGAVWSITAATQVVVTVQRAVARSGFDNVDSTDATTSLPAQFSWFADHLSKTGDPRIRRLVSQWFTATRKLAADAKLPVAAPWFRLWDMTPVARNGTTQIEFDGPHPYRRWVGNQRIPGAFEGDAEFVLDIRPVVSAAHPPGRRWVIEVRINGEPYRLEGEASVAKAPFPRIPTPFEPVGQPLQIAPREFAGWKERLRLQLPPGRHDVQYTMSGGPLLVRLTRAQRKPRTGERSPWKAIEKVYGSLGRLPSAEARIFRAVAGKQLGFQDEPRLPETEDLALRAYATLLTAPSTGAEAARRLMQAEAWLPGRLWGEAKIRWLQDLRPEQAKALYFLHARIPENPHLLAEFAVAIAPLFPGDPQALQLVDEAWHKAPADEPVIAAYPRIWRTFTDWQVATLAQSQPEMAWIDPVPYGTWVTTAGAYWKFQNQSEISFIAREATGRLVGFYGLQPLGAQAEIEDITIPLLELHRSIELLTPPGRHVLRWETPFSGYADIDHAAGTSLPDGRLHRLTPLQPGNRTYFAPPTQAGSNIVRVRARLLSARAARLRLGSESGNTVELAVASSEKNDDVFAFSRAHRYPLVEGTVSLPASRGALWVEADAPVAVEIAFRVARAPIASWSVNAPPVTALTVVTPASAVLHSSPALWEKYRQATRIARTEPFSAAQALADLYQETGVWQAGVEALDLLPADHRSGALASVVMESLETDAGLQRIGRRQGRPRARWTRAAQPWAGGGSRTFYAPQSTGPVRVAPGEDLSFLLTPVSSARASTARCLATPILSDACDYSVNGGAPQILLPGREVPLRLAAGEHSIRNASKEPAASLEIALYQDGVPQALFAQERYTQVSPQVPYTFPVSGETALRIRARTVADTDTTLFVQTGGPAGPKRAWALPGTPDRSVKSGPLQTVSVSITTEMIYVLPAAGIRSVSVTAAADAFVSLAAWREVAGDFASQVTTSSAIAAPLPFAPPAGDVLAQNEGTYTQSAYSQVVRNGLDELEEPVVQTAAWETGAALREALLPERMWLLASPFVRMHEDTPPTGGLWIRSYMRRLPGDLRLGLRSQGLFQPVGSRPASSWLVGGRADRGFELSPDVELLPALTVTREWFSQGAAQAHVDPLVATLYRRSHDLRAEPELMARWTPRLDQQWSAMVRLTSNRELKSFDHHTARLRWARFWGWQSNPLRTHLLLTPSYWRRDDNRSDAFWRWGAGAGVDWALRSSQRQRLLLVGDVTHYWTTRDQRLLTGRIGLRWDWFGAAGWGDLLPPEESFSALQEAAR